MLHSDFQSYVPFECFVTLHINEKISPLWVWVGAELNVNQIKRGLKMPKIYEYMGITLFFYSNEHEPIHIHGKFQGRESKAEIHLFNGRVNKITIKDKGLGLEAS